MQDVCSPTVIYLEQVQYAGFLLRSSNCAFLLPAGIMELENKLSHVHHQEYEHLSGATGRTWLTSVWGNYSPEGFSLTIYKVIGKHIFPLKAMQFSIFKSVLHEANIKRQHFLFLFHVSVSIYICTYTLHTILDYVNLMYYIYSPCLLLNKVSFVRW